MSCHVTVYQKGYTHKINGIHCDLKRIELIDLDEHLENGWVRTVADLAPKKRQHRKPKVETVDTVQEAVIDESTD